VALFFRNSRFRFIYFLPFCLPLISLASEDIPPSLDDIEISLDIPEIDLESNASEKSHWYDMFRYSLAWQNGLDLNQLSEINSHRFDTRITADDLIFETLYYKVDGKLLWRLPKDNNISENKNVELDYRVAEFYLQKNINAFTITAGFQRIALGQMDAVQVSDVFTPWDFSEFAFTAPEDARLGQLILNTQWFSQYGTWQLLVNAWPTSNNYPGGDSDTLLKQLLNSDNVYVDDHQPEFLRDYETVLRWQHKIQKNDFALIYANLLTNQPSFVQQNTNSNFHTRYDRYHMLAMSSNYSAGNFLWKLEIAWKNELEVDPSVQGKSTIIDGAIGFDYDANGAWAMSTELFNQHRMDNFNVDKNNTLVVSRISKNWRHDTLTSVAFVSYSLQHKDVISSAALNYSMTDNWKSELNATIFHSTNKESPGYLSRNWDQITLRVFYSF